MAKNYYDVLGVPKNATAKQIRDAYRRLSRKWHPDVNPGNKEAEEKFKEISSAYDVIGNEEKRKLYDEFGEEGLRPGFQPEAAREYKRWEGAQAGRQRTAEEFGRFHSYEDLFGDMFNFGRGGFSQTHPFKGSDIESSITIDLVSALKGMDTEVSLNKAKTCPTCKGTGVNPNTGLSTCTVCSGSGRINISRGPMQFTKTCPRCGGSGKIGKECPTCYGEGIIEGVERIRVTIPAGVKDGYRLRLPGKGEPGSPGGQPGDLYITVHVAEHPLLNREGDNLSMEVPITVREAMAGGTITVPTIEGQIRVKVPPKSQSGQRLKVRGKGAVNPKTGQRGDLFIKLIVKVPRTENEEALKAVEKLEDLYTENVRAGIRL
ncbi:MAG TPA: molecular chaperone DnaJ [Deltaproteobacteria bacterium]|mgnify:CR=1 FL=1|jgi:molecular chaperone DnaJ|nr:molecular chaperone DnaJ [Deltaproteobacteria bacterium]HQH99796.1 molecular chaperone DnaJ [Deltaproteobacteria bacterium]